MKILHVTGYYIREMAYQENLLPKGQSELGHDVVVITGTHEPRFKFNGSDRINPVGEFLDATVKILRLPIHFEIPSNRGPVLKNLYKAIKKESPDILFIHDIGPSLFVGLYYKLVNPTVILQFDCHSTEDNAANSIFGPLYHLFFGIVFKLSGHLLDNIFAVSPETVSFMEKRYFIDRKNIELLPLPGDASLMNRFHLNRQKMRQKYNFKNDEKILVHTGKLPEDKLTKEVLDACLYLDKLGFDFKLVIIGNIDQNFADNNTEILSSSWVEFLGWRSPAEIREVFIASDLLVQPGSLSNTFIDGICCGLPVLLDDTPQGRFLTKFNNGSVLKRKNIARLGEVLHSLLQHDNHKNLQINSIQIAQNFHYLQIAKQTLKTYEK